MTFEVSGKFQPDSLRLWHKVKALRRQKNNEIMDYIAIVAETLDKALDQYIGEDIYFA